MGTDYYLVCMKCYKERKLEEARVYFFKNNITNPVDNEEVEAFMGVHSDCGHPVQPFQSLRILSEHSGIVEDISDFERNLENKNDYYVCSNCGKECIKRCDYCGRCESLR